MLLIVFFTLIMLISVFAVLYATRQPVPRKTMQTRLTMIKTKTGDSASVDIELAAKRRPGISERLSDLVRQHRVGSSLEQLIQHAGSNWSVGKVVVIGAGSASGLALAVHLLFGPLFLALPGAVVGGMFPYLYLKFLRSRRLKKFDAALPDAIDLMSRALRAGHSTASSIEVIAEQSPEPLASEFARCFQQQKFGIPYREALLAMGERVPSDDLQFMITAVLVQKETGGDLTDILDRTTAVIRDRMRVQGEVRTRTAQGRMTGWILSALPVVLLVAINIITPGYSHILFYDPIGQKLMIGGAVLIGIGGFIISRIVDIKV